MSPDTQPARHPRAGGSAARSTFFATVALAAAAWGIAPAHAAVRPTQELAALLGAHDVFAAPSRGAPRVGRLEARRPLTATRTVLPVVGHSTGVYGVRWLRVRLPGRPNGRTGWIKRRRTAASTTSWRIVVRTSVRSVLVYRDGRHVRTFSGVVGAPSTPTPHGEFFVEEAIELRPWDVGAPFALALSARSNVLQEFAGGPGQIGIHGLANVGGVPGTSASHGCVRLDGAAIRWLAHRIGAGVPVTING